MRMSMKARIFSIVGLILLVTLVIAGTSFYGITRLSKTVGAMGSQARRTINLQVMDRIALGRHIATVDVIMTTDEAAMKQIIDGALAQLPKAMEAELADYLANCPSPVPPLYQERHDTIKNLWAEYVKQTDAVAALSYANSNNKALAINEGLQDFWDALDQDCLRLTEFIRVNNRDANEAVRRAKGARISILRFRLNLNKYISEENPVHGEAFRRATDDHFKAVHDALAELSKTLPAAGGGAMAGEILRNLQATGDDAYRRMVDLAHQDTNVRAKALLASAAVPARAKLDAYTAEIQASNMRNMTGGIEAGIALGERVEWLVGGISAVGVAVSVVLAFVIVNSLVRGLNRIIGELNESSAQVTAAAGQISMSSQKLAEGSTEQAASLEETSSALEEMASMTRQNADNANDTTLRNNKLITAGSTAVGNISNAMAEITDSAEQISRIIKMIEDIAFQTNLLPLNAAVEAAPRARRGRYSDSKRDRNAQRIRAKLPHARVLVVDDVATNLDVVRGMMKPYEMKIDCATSGRQAVEMIRAEKRRYDAVFMDHMMPGMDGIEAARIIREEIDTEYARTIPLIALTANAIVGTEEMFLNSGFQDFISKPIDMAKLDAILRRWVRDGARDGALPE